MRCHGAPAGGVIVRKTHRLYFELEFVFHDQLSHAQLPNLLSTWRAVVFGTRRLHLGGPMRTNRMHVLHTQPGVAKSMAVLPGVYTGGLDDLLEKVLAGEMSGSGVRCDADPVFLLSVPLF